MKQSEWTTSKTVIVLASLIWFTLDCLSKVWIRSHLSSGQSIVLIPGIFQLTHATNTGAAFSLFRDAPTFLIITSLVMLGCIGTYVLMRPILARPEVFGYSLIIGGAVGNLVDRVRFGAVTDFLDFCAIHYPIFNVADSCIFIGVVVLVVYYVINQTQAPHT